MYQYISSVNKPNTVGARWQSGDISNLTLKEIYRNNAVVVMKLNSTELGRVVNVDLFKLDSDLRASTRTLSQFLIDNGNTTLPTVETFPVIKEKYVKYADAFHAGYSIEPIHRTASIGVDYTDADKTDAILTRPDTDYSVFNKHCLVSVNGLFHMTDYSDKGAYVIDANKSRRISGKNRVGLYSFMGIGEIKLIPITKEMIYKFDENVLLSTRMQIKLPEAIGNKTPMIVIGGYLHALDDSTYRVINEDTISVELLNVPLIERYYEAMNTIDLNSLGLEFYERNYTQIELEQFYSDETILEYMTLSQSFIVLVDNSSMFKDRKHLELTKLSGMAISHIVPNLPLITNYGQVNEYWYVPEDGKYSIRYFDSERKNYLFRTTEESDLNSATSELVGYNPSNQTQAHFLFLGSDL